MDTTAPGEHAAASRRRFLQAVGLGGALSALPLLARSAGAQSTSTAADTTTTAPPKRPTDADIELLVFAQSVELAAVRAYATALERSEELAIPADLAPVLQVFREHHIAYASNLSGFLGRDAPNAANQGVLDELGEPFSSGSLAEVLEAAAAFEDAAVDTHLTILGELVGTDGAALVASIIPVEARHAAVLGMLAGGEVAMPTGETDLANALTADDFPVE